MSSVSAINPVDVLLPTTPEQKPAAEACSFSVSYATPSIDTNRVTLLSADSDESSSKATVMTELKTIHKKVEVRPEEIESEEELEVIPGTEDFSKEETVTIELIRSGDDLRRTSPTVETGRASPRSSCPSSPSLGEEVHAIFEENELPVSKPQETTKSSSLTIAEVAFRVFGSLVVGTLSLGIGYLSLSFVATDFVPSVLAYSATPIAIKALSSIEALFIAYKLLPVERSPGMLAKTISTIVFPIIATVGFGMLYFSFGIAVLHFLPLYADARVMCIALNVISLVGAIILAHKFCLKSPHPATI